MEHDDFGVCPFVTAQRLLQGKWAIILLHQLYDGTKRFGELERATGITHATLASQLKALEKDGLITRHVYSEVPPRVEYTLTDMGRRFGPVLSSIETWGNEYIAYLRTQK